MTGRARRPFASWSLASLLWSVAFSTVGLASIILPANAASVTGLAILGHLLTSVALAIDLQRGRRRGPRDAAFLSGVILVFALIELLGWIVSRAEGEADQSVWFAVALSFAAAGMLATWRGGGSDGAIAAQLFFHGVLIVPALAAFSTLCATEPGSAGPVARWLLIVTCITMPPLFAMLAAVLAYDLSRTSEHASPLWPALVAHESAYVVLAVRWAFDGL